MNLSEDDLRRMGYEIRDGVAMRAEKGVMPSAAVESEHGRAALSAVTHAPQTRPSKYRNRATYVGEARFDSIHEAECWLALQAMERAGTIWDLERQVPYELHCGTESGLRIEFAKYFADFRWRDANGVHIGDAKSPITRKAKEYRLKCRVMLLEHNIAIEEL